ncbi:MAG: hypothetical protein OEW19_18420 [Acidobacteriota bacterium]|nr:hypothetical protein [Acidobacteriota bacterium]
MNHLSRDELVDAAEGTLPPVRGAHLASCEACRDEVAQLMHVLREAAEVPVPEPSPLFWDHFSARVRDAVADEALPTSGRSVWLRWPTLAPFGALALVLLALVASLLRPDVSVTDRRAGGASMPRAGTTDAALGRESWEFVAELVGPLDWDTAGAAGIGVVPGDVDSLLLALDADERRELSRLLEGELAKTKS